MKWLACDDSDHEYMAKHSLLRVRNYAQSQLPLQMVSDVFEDIPLM